MKKKPGAAKIAYSCVILVLVLVMLFSGLRILESTVLFKEQQEDQIQSKTIEYNGISYYPRQDITTMLIMGIDETGPVVESEYYNNSGEADMVALVIFDEKDEKIDVICLNRDTMLEMPVLGINGKPAGTKMGQLALSHVQGTGLEDSCENTVTTVSNFLYGVTIDYYVAMNMDAIAILNDAVGGVTVNVTDDFSGAEYPIEMGEQTLRGQQALTYVQVRKDVGDQNNISRMERHKAYMQGFLKAFRQSNESESFVLDTYELVDPYMVTNCTAKGLSSMLSRYEDYELREIVSPEGENVLGSKYMEFYVDEEKLHELILRLLYAPK